MMALPKEVSTSKLVRVVPHLDNDTEEDDLILAKSKITYSILIKQKNKVEYSYSDYDYESTYTSKVWCIFSR